MAGISDLFGIRYFSAKQHPSNTADREPFREGYVDLGSKTAPTGDVKGAVLGINDAFAAMLSIGDPNSLHTNHQFFTAYKKSSAVAIPVNLISENFSQVNPVLENQETGEVLQAHELLDLLRRPHSLFSQALFLDTNAKHFLITGEAPIVALGSINQPPAMLQPLNPTNLSMTADNTTGLPKSVKISGRSLNGIYKTDMLDMGSTFQDGDDRSLKILRSFSTQDDSLLRGQSKLVSAAKDVWQQLEGSDYNLSLLQQGGRASLIFSFKNTLHRDVFMERKGEILTQVQGADNAGRILVTHGGELDIKEASASNKDMEYQSGQQSARNVLAQTYKVPIVLITTDAATFNNFEMATLALWDDAIMPLSATVLGGLGEWLLPSYNVDPSVWSLTFDKMRVNALRSRLLNELKKRKDLGVESVNEIRKSMPGLEPVEGGEEILVSGTLTPLSAVAQDVDSGLLPPLPPSPLPPADPDPGE